MMMVAWPDLDREPQRARDFFRVARSLNAPFKIVPVGKGTSKKSPDGLMPSGEISLNQNMSRKISLRMMRQSYRTYS